MFAGGRNAFAPNPNSVYAEIPVELNEIRGATTDN
jgi:hypothetical protein